MNKKALRRLIKDVESVSTNMTSDVHGPQHWKCVAKLGIKLAQKTPGADPLVCFLFGLFHDSMRVNDHTDPDHGTRGAILACQFKDQILQVATFEQLQKVVYACCTHTTSDATTDPVIGCCYDADRLNLWRVGKVPSAFYISTVPGLVLVRNWGTRDMHEKPLEWESVLRLL